MTEVLGVKMARRESYVLNLPKFSLEDIDVWLERADDETSISVTNLMRSSFDRDSLGALKYFVRGGNKEKVYDYHVLPSGLSVPIVSQELMEALSDVIPSCEALFVPVVLLNLNNDFKCWALAPTEHRPCTDLAKSAVRSWLIPGSVVLKFDTMRLRDDALGERSIVRDSNYPAHVVVSSKVADVFNRFKSANFEVVSGIF
ncbi:hypothetical protein [Pannonibacter tanglangensis]|uniref:Uncharacterized protein n=1 Tax=Pannonibacter tanglangensis TaxID=2750084 RepID=A0ABW9ZTP9_9HYPH|nr:hypothetical protein [Pannonibacter sp. XCT-34]NBN66075.1 hypothetical protein [Pannonibacter sp. XCT-34]